jgi:hypothetical protein
VRPLVTLRSAFDNPNLLAPVMGGESREPMRALLLASQGETLTDSEREHFRRLTQRDHEPGERVEEAHILAGRRSGKSSGCAAMAVYTSALCDFSDRLSPGEKGVVLIIAENQRQASVLLRYVEGAFDSSPTLRKLIVNRTRTTLELNNGITIEVRSADFRGLRGLTLVAVIADEICFWRSEDSANPDSEIIDAVRPGLVTTRGQLFTIGSPYAKRGFAYQTCERHFGEQGDPHILVARGATREFNATVPEEIINRALERDPAAAMTEWLGQFRDDIDGYVNREVVMACVSPGVYERPFVPGQRYSCFLDPAGGSGRDSMTLAIAHREKDVAILDAIREVRPPFSPDAVSADLADFVKSYRIHAVTGDRWGGEFVREQFKKRGLRYDISEKIKSDLYRELLPSLNSRRVDLLDNARVVSQLCSLERRTGRGTGRDVVDHPRGLHDDLANACAGALVLALGNARRPMVIPDELLRWAARPQAYRGWPSCPIQSAYG